MLELSRFRGYRYDGTTRQFQPESAQGVCEMHDMIGSAGMLRGWIAMWTTQAFWLFASLTVSVGAAAVAEF